MSDQNDYVLNLTAMFYDNMFVLRILVGIQIVFDFIFRLLLTFI